MRTKMVAGNWKMNKTLQEGVALATELKQVVKNPSCEVVIGTPFIHLATVAELLKGSPVKVAAENCADKEKAHSLVKYLQKWLNQQALNTAS